VCVRACVCVCVCVFERESLCVCVCKREIRDRKEKGEDGGEDKQRKPEACEEKQAGSHHGPVQTPGIRMTKALLSALVKSARQHMHSKTNAVWKKRVFRPCMANSKSP